MAEDNLIVDAGAAEQPQQDQPEPGERPLSDADRAMLAAILQSGNEVGGLLAILAKGIRHEIGKMPIIPGGANRRVEVQDADRWLAIAHDHLQQGFMCLRRAVKRPLHF